LNDAIGLIAISCELPQVGDEIVELAACSPVAGLVDHRREP
jgi:hypothetical protein